MLNLYARVAVFIAARMAEPRRRDRGATAVEYALIIAGVAAVLAVVVFALEDVLTQLFNDTCNAIDVDAATC
ncbi:pilus assembly protein Flp/PilA [Catenuloplanes nepalensis]|uniref:Pilus assembly protein Flp/PilA n=1 Tax=Catenuloplanes nepalensis TaxID=587533 RepID=A0ABT9N5M8_9ACTN|nr:Flp family type IVb pilin [Catenuloplanes nepalensis]MDP9798546.1 pilus assembly protein Flp/PilA [Catenuloplanes nepalensis]